MAYEIWRLGNNLIHTRDVNTDIHALISRSRSRIASYELILTTAGLFQDRAPNIIIASSQPIIFNLCLSLLMEDL